MVPVVSNDLHEILVERIEAEGPIPFVRFCELALYDPKHGYYATDRTRTGADRKADFVTNLAVRSVFAPLVVECLKTLCGPETGDFRFVEIGAEPGTSLLEGCDHPFASVTVVRFGDAVPQPDGPTVVFANEWLDALPFVRLRFQNGVWAESVVCLEDSGQITEGFASPVLSEDAREIVPLLPREMPEGYRLDLSAEAERLLDRMLTGSWPGVFLTFDYGSRWDALLHHLPEGTARAYRGHQHSDNLLLDPGKQDLTCNVCWDRIANVCRKNRFVPSGPERQEAFLFQHAMEEVRQIVEGGQDPVNVERRAKLQQLLNPAHFGAAFQAFRAIRR